MRYEEYCTKWKTDKTVPGKCRLINVPGQPTIERQFPVHVSFLGDFIKDYMDHLKIPWWRKKYDWNMVEEKMRKSVLNQITLTWTEL